MASARAMVPFCGPIASASAPEGMSTAITGALPAFSKAMASAYSPLTGGLNPVPRIASRYKSAAKASWTRLSFKSPLERTTIGGSGSFTNMAAASPCRSSRSASRMTCTVFPASCNLRAATNPSPPLLPLPQKTRIFWASGWCARTYFATADPAFSISVKDGTPKRSLVARSMARISAAVTIFI